MEPFLGEIIMFGGNFAPRDWAFCDGQLLPIASNTGLFSILGTTYGGDGRTTFGLPDLRGRLPMHPGSGNGLSTRQWGQKGGAENATLSVNEMPTHAHKDASTASADTGAPANKVPAASSENIYNDDNSPDTTIGSGSAGGGQAHTNVQPITGINFIIALQGTFPSRN